jgi:hypothetical protein
MTEPYCLGRFTLYPDKRQLHSDGLPTPPAEATHRRLSRRAETCRLSGPNGGRPGETALTRCRAPEGAAGSG